MTGLIGLLGTLSRFPGAEVESLRPSTIKVAPFSLELGGRKESGDPSRRASLGFVWYSVVLLVTFEHSLPFRDLLHVIVFSNVFRWPLGSM